MPKASRKSSSRSVEYTPSKHGKGPAGIPQKRRREYEEESEDESVPTKQARTSSEPSIGGEPELLEGGGMAGGGGGNITGEYQLPRRTPQLFDFTVRKRCTAVIPAAQIGANSQVYALCDNHPNAYLFKSMSADGSAVLSDNNAAVLTNPAVALGVGYRLKKRRVKISNVVSYSQTTTGVPTTVQGNLAPVVYIGQDNDGAIVKVKGAGSGQTGDAASRLADQIEITNTGGVLVTAPQCIQADNTAVTPSQSWPFDYLSDVKTVAQGNQVVWERTVDLAHAYVVRPQDIPAFTGTNIQHRALRTVALTPADQQWVGIQKLKGAGPNEEYNFPTIEGNDAGIYMWVRGTGADTTPAAVVDLEFELDFELVFKGSQGQGFTPHCTPEGIFTADLSPDTDFGLLRPGAFRSPTGDNHKWDIK